MEVDVRHKHGGEDFFATAMSATQLPMIITDPRQADNPIVFVNDAFQRLTGYERKDVIGRNCRFLQGPETDHETVAHIRKAIADETDLQVDILNYRKDGSTFWNALYLSAARDRNGAVRFFFASQIDVSERIEAQRFIADQKATVEREIERQTIALTQLKQAKDAAEGAVRQQSEFLANMSHELRTPLMSILGLHDLLHADPMLGPKQHRYLRMAREAGRSLLSVLNDVLDLSKIEANALTVEKLPFSVPSLIKTCEELAAEAARAKGLTLNVHVAASLPLLLGDALRLKQVLMNLISNAVRFTDQGSVTVISRYDIDRGQLRFEVSDTGIGIQDYKITTLFKRFNQVDTSITRRYGGTGLGLAICKRLTELMEGQIGVTSVPGIGSTFWFEIPIQKTDGEMSYQESSSPGISSPKRVLLAEDNLVNQEIIKAMLEARGHIVMLVSDGAAATEAARFDPPFDLILMDLQMPVMDGLSATRAIRSAEQAEGRRPTPIIGLTANAMPTDIKRCLGAGMEEHVAKPIEWAGLFAAMERVECRSASMEVTS